jgi:hypothetical protein
LLPTNHFGARKKRSAEQALLLLQEHIYNAWRKRRVLTLVSFDIKGAYNGVCKERLLQRLAARGIPSNLVRWIGAFCSNRRATILVNGHCSERTELEQAGLPQGSPLSPILFLFFNADLVQQKLDQNGGSIAFVDDYTAWVTGHSAEANRENIQAVIDQAMDWERRSGATFESDKTVLVHFTRNSARTDERPITIKGQEIRPAARAKILGVVMDSELRYKEHIAKAATKGLNAAMALRRLNGLSPATARRLFEATVAPVVDYASGVWMHACGSLATATLNRIQKIGAQAVTGCFRTVATAVAEVEASIRPVRQRQVERATKLWISLRTLAETHPLSRIGTRIRKRFKSPLQRIAAVHSEIATDGVERIVPYVLAPWDARLHAIIVTDADQAKEMRDRPRSIRISTSSSARKGVVGMGGAMDDGQWTRLNEHYYTYSCTLGPRTAQNPYVAELVAIAEGLARLSPMLRNQEIRIFTRNRAAVRAVSQPEGQSGQRIIGQIYTEVKRLKGRDNRVVLIGVPGTTECTMIQQAKAAARDSTEPGRVAAGYLPAAKSTMINMRKTAGKGMRSFTSDVGWFTRRLDIALPGPHTRTIYNSLGRKQANILAQLRTGMARLNGYLYRIGAAESDQCMCGHGKETVEHFLFRCRKWGTHRREMLEQTETRRGNLSFFLGGKTHADPPEWTPNLDAVKATIKYAISTGRLDADPRN